MFPARSNQFPTRTILAFAIVTITAPMCSIAGTLADYDSGWSLNSSTNRLEHGDSGIWTTLDNSHAIQNITIGNGNGIEGNSAKVDITGYGTDGLFKIYFAYDEDRYSTLKAAAGNNRMFLYVTIPAAGNGDAEHTFHIGTYSKNPETARSTTNLGNHWYHYYQLRGNDKGYWTKMYMDERPQHVVSSKITPDTNPTAVEGFDYFDGLTRLYLQMRYSPFESNWPGPYTMHVDHVVFYNEARPENDYSINGVAITYRGTGEFDLDWSSFSVYERHQETFEVRYSYAPINTETDYQAAKTVPGSPSGGWGQENMGSHDNHYRANFVIPSFDESRTVYFAIKDLYSDHPKALKRVDYNVGSAVPVAEKIPPMPPSNVSIQ